MHMIFDAAHRVNDAAQFSRFGSDDIVTIPIREQSITYGFW